MGNVFDVSVAGTVKADNDVHTVVNKINAADMDGTRSTTRFSLYTYPDMSEITAATMTVGCETDMDSSAATHDGYIDFHTGENGAIAHAARITSNGYVGVGTVTPSARLEVIGNAIVDGNVAAGCLAGSCSGARIMSITSSGSTSMALTGSRAVLNMSSTSAASSLDVTASTEGHVSRFDLFAGPSFSYSLISNRTLGGFAIVTEAVQPVLHINTSNSVVTIYGDLSVGTAPGRDNTMSLLSDNADASVDIISTTSSAGVTIFSAAGISPAIQLIEGSGTSYDMSFHAASSEFRLASGGSNYITTDTLGRVAFQNMNSGLTFGGGSMMINSTGATASLAVNSSIGGSLLHLSSVNGSSSTVLLGEGPRSFELSNDIASHALKLSTNTFTLLSVSNVSGDILIPAGLNISSLSTSGPSALNVHSAGKAAAFDVSSGGSSAATVSVTSPSGHARLHLQKSNHSWDIVNNGTTDALQVGSNSNKVWLSIGTSGEAVFNQDLTSEGNLIIGGNDVSGPRSVSITSKTGNATLGVTAGTYGMVEVSANSPAADAMVTIKAANTRDAALKFQHGSNTVTLKAHGVTDSFVIGSSTDWFRLSNNTGNVMIPGALAVGTDKLYVDSTTGFVGVGTTSPQVPLHVYGETGCKVSKGNSTTAFQVLSSSSSKLGGYMLSVDTNNSRVGIGTASPSESLDIYGGSLKIEEFYPQMGDIDVHSGAIHLSYLPHDSATSKLGGSQNFCMKIGTGVAHKDVGDECSSACGGDSPQSACDSTTCGVGGWCK